MTKQFLESEIQKEKDRIAHFEMKLELMKESLKGLESKLKSLNKKSSKS